MKKPKLICCEPQLVPFASGSHWCHSRFCPVNRLQKVTAVDVKKALRPTQFQGHPAGQDLPIGGLTSVRIWMAHDGDGCDHCRYVDAHLDEADDIEPSGAYL